MTTQAERRYAQAVLFARQRGLTEPRAHSFARYCAKSDKPISFLWDDLWEDETDGW